MQIPRQPHHHIQMSFHLNFTNEQSQLSQRPTTSHLHHRRRRKPTPKVMMAQPNAFALRTIPECWKTFSKSPAPIFTLPIEIHLRIFELLHPIDAICLSLTCTYIYAISPTNPLSPSSDPNNNGEIHEHSYLGMVPTGIPLNLGKPDSDHPAIKRSGCKFCVPVLYYPAHCELHYHIKGFMPKDMTYCGGTCQKYTLSAGERERRRVAELYASEDRRQRKGKEREIPAPRPQEVFSFEYTNAMAIDIERPLIGYGDELIASDDESLPSTQNEFTTQRDGFMEYQIEVPDGDQRIIVHEDIIPGQRLLGRRHWERVLLRAGSSGREIAQQWMAERYGTGANSFPRIQSHPRVAFRSFYTGSPPMPASFVTAHASGTTNRSHRRQQVREPDADTLCGRCGVSYMHMYSRGRRHLELLRPGEKPGRVRKWYNQSVYNKPGRMRNDDDGSTTGRDDDDD